MAGFPSYATRYEIGATYEEDGQQFVDGKGYASDGFERAHRLESYGLYTNPPEGSIGAVLAQGGNRDSAYAVGVEHPKYRPRGLVQKDVALYHADGRIWKMVEDVTSFDAKSLPLRFENVKELLLQSQEKMKLEPAGDFSVKTNKSYVGPGPTFARVMTEVGLSQHLYATVSA